LQKGKSILPVYPRVYPIQHALLIQKVGGRI